VEPSQQRAERSRDLERFLTFVDAIVAVAITVLVLPLVDLAGEIRSDDDSVSELIRSHAGQFWAFGLSFVVIARLWLAQHRLMRLVVATNQAILIYLILWTFAIVFLPFPTALLSNGGDQAITKCLYIGTLGASSLCLTLLAVAIKRDSSVRESDVTPSAVPAAATVVLLAAALLITLVFPSTSYYPLLLLLASDGVTTLWRKIVADPRQTVTSTNS
jgi:uncharacterized membrane protein